MVEKALNAGPSPNEASICLTTDQVGIRAEPPVKSQTVDAAAREAGYDVFNTRVNSPHTGGGPTHEQHVVATFCFVDIAGYSALTDSHGEHAAADLVDDFNGLIHAAVDPFGTVHELSGDNAFLVFAEPVMALRAVTKLYGMVADQRDLPLVRTGLNHGAALLRANRYFGSTVNIAARTTAQATGGEILCTRAVVDGLPVHERGTTTIAFRDRVTLKNLPDPIDLYAIGISDLARRYMIDPVCQMQVDSLDAGGTLMSGGRQWWFCASECARRFEANPDAFLNHKPTT